MKLVDLNEARYAVDKRLPDWVPQKFQDRIVVDDFGHWIWKAGMTSDMKPTAYAPDAPNHLGTSNKRVRPHRLLWNELHGHLPRNQHLRKLCPEEWCVNPEHYRLIPRSK